MRRLMMFGALLLMFCGCSSKVNITGKSDASPVIFPDYKDVTVPVNVAPLNFEVIDSLERDWALMIETAGDVR